MPLGLTVAIGTGHTPVVKMDQKGEFEPVLPFQNPPR